MKNVILSLLIVGLFAATPEIALADQVGMTFGGDAYAAGQTVTLNEGATHDAFIAGYNVALSGAVAGDAHLGGFDVQSNAPTRSAHRAKARPEEGVESTLFGARGHCSCRRRPGDAISSAVPCAITRNPSDLMAVS